jgi:hypothetical protein
VTVPHPSTVAADLVAELRKSLGESFVIVDRLDDPHLRGVGLKGAPDIAILDKDRDHWILVEVKGSGADATLPFPMLPAVLEIRERNAALHPDMVLVSTSRVPEAYRGYIESSGIRVVEGSRAADVAPALVGLIRG